MLINLKECYNEEKININFIKLIQSIINDMSTKLALTTVNDSLIAEFKGKKANSKQKLNFIQLASPPNTSLKEIERNKFAWGVFLPLEQAEAIGFKPNKDYQLTNFTFGLARNEDKEVPGYLTRHLRLSFIKRSEPEIEERTDKGWKYLGKAYSNGELTKYGQLAEKDKKQYRMRTRNLILLLDKDNSPLHVLPLSFGFSRGIGGSVSNALSDFYSQCDSVIAELSKDLEGTQYNDLIHSRCVFDVEFKLHKNTNAPFFVPAKYLVPTLQETGIEVIKTQSERQVTTVTELFQNLYISENSETGQTINSLFEAFESFSTRTTEIEV